MVTTVERYGTFKGVSIDTIEMLNSSNQEGSNPLIEARCQAVHDAKQGEDGQDKRPVRQRNIVTKCWRTPWYKLLRIIDKHSWLKSKLDFVFKPIQFTTQLVATTM